MEEGQPSLKGNEKETVYREPGKSSYCLPQEPATLFNSPEDTDIATSGTHTEYDSPIGPLTQPSTPGSLSPKSMSPQSTGSRQERMRRQFPYQHL